MNPTRRDILRARVKERMKSEPASVDVPAEVVEVDGSVDVTTKPGYVWVQENFQAASNVPALNDQGFLLVAGTPVILRKTPGKELNQERRIIALNVDSITGADNVPVSRFTAPYHYQNHQWPDESNPGPDPVRIYQPAVMMLKAVYNGSSLVVSVQPLTYHSNGAFKYFSGQSVNLTSYVPSTSGRAKRVLLYLDTETQQIAVAQSAEVTASLTEPTYPPVPADDIPSAYFKLTNGQTALTAANYTDARMLINSYDSVSVPASFTSTSAPTVNDDESTGAEQFSLWFKTTTDAVWICADPSEGAAVWVRIDNGSASDPLDDVFADTAEFGQLIVNTEVASDLDFDADGTREVGSTTARAQIVHTDEVDLNGVDINSNGTTVTVEGDTTVGDGTGQTVARINGAAGNVRDLKYQSGGVDRIIWRLSSTAESGSNAGSDMEVLVRNDAGGSIRTAMLITRSTGSVKFGWSVVVGNPTGGDKGFGTGNFQGDVYKNNTAYTNPDYALEWWATGAINRYKNNVGAAGYKRYTLAEVKAHITENFRLPGIDDQPMGMFARGDFLLEKVEELYTHCIELNERIEKLERKRHPLKSLKQWLLNFVWRN